MSLSAPFIRRPVATTLLTIGVAMAGALAYLLLPVSPLPQVDFPTISVSASLPGASPETMASSVATPLERQFGRIAGITEMTSNSQTGSCSITMQFDLSRDIDAAARDVQAAINAARSQLPANLPGNPTYRKVNPADAPILILALTSDFYDKPAMYDAASSVLAQKLSQVQGVGQVSVGGSSLPAVRAEINPTLLNQTGLGLEDVRSVLGTANANMPKGQLANGRQTWTVETTDQLLRASQYRKQVVAQSNGAIIRLGDIGSVVDSVENTRTVGLANGKPAVLLVISRQPAANIIDTADRVLAMMPTLQAEIPAAIHMSVVMDRTVTIRASVRDVEVTLLISIGLVVLVVFVFLRDVRSTLIPSVVVPISLLGTFGVMYLCNYSLDNLSLMAMTIATGFVVDDAIVVIENITRYLEEGMSPVNAALEGAKQIGFTVVSISVSLVAVFIPILLMSGYVGRLFREFAVTLSVAIGVSMVISLTTTPMMCAVLLRPHGHARQHGWLYRITERGFDWVLARYERSLATVLRHPLVTLTVTLLTVALTVYLYTAVPTTFFPQQDTGRIGGNIQADQSTSAQTMSKLVARYADVVRQDPDVTSVVAFAGGGTSNSGFMFVTLKSLGHGKDDRKISADEVINRLRRPLNRIPGGSLFLQPFQDVRVGGRSSNAQYQYTLQADQLADLMTWGPKLVDKLKTMPGLADVNSDQQTHGLSTQIVVDRQTASRLGISSEEVDNTLYDAFGQRQVSTMYRSLNQYHVVMEVDPSFAAGPDSLRYVRVRAGNGVLIPLSVFSKIVQTTTPLGVNHQGQFPSITISFNLLPGMSLGDAVSAVNTAEADLVMPPTIHGAFAGTAAAYQQSQSDNWLLIVAALATVYIVLGVLYESLIHPITILSTIPSAGVGALLALLVCQTDLSLVALIGIILLIGIVKKNAIMMIDFALEAERGQGLSPRDAIFQACVLRFRPIMMTTMAALLGGLPLAMGTGTGSELRKPLGIAIVGGLIFSQMLTLYTTPVIYLYLDRLSLWLRGLRPPRDHEAPQGVQPV